MPIGPFTNAKVIINGTDLSDHVDQVTITDSRAPVDITAMGAAFTTYTKGVGTCKIDLEMFQDFDAAKVHATLQPLIASSTPITVEVRPNNAARSATNPAAVMAGALLPDYLMLDGKFNDAMKTKVSFINGVGSGISYPTS